MFSRLILTACLALTIQQANAQNANHSHQGTDAQEGHTDAQATVLPLEAGQSAFAAIAEIVAILNADPQTDWASVDIDALREHLLDMDLLTLETSVDTELRDDGASFTVLSDGRALEATQRMVLAHAPVLSQATGWRTSVESNENGALLIVRSDQSEEVLMIQALGFYGVMATGAHHQEHHLAIALGSSPH